MPRISKIKIGDRVAVLPERTLFGVVVWQQSDSSFDVHFDIKYNKANLKEVRNSRGRFTSSQIEKVKPVSSVTELIEEDEK